MNLFKFLDYFKPLTSVERRFDDYFQYIFNNIDDFQVNYWYNNGDKSFDIKIYKHSYNKTSLNIVYNASSGKMDNVYFQFLPYHMLINDVHYRINLKLVKKYRKLIKELLHKGIELNHIINSIEKDFGYNFRSTKIKNILNGK